MASVKLYTIVGASTLQFSLVAFVEKKRAAYLNTIMQMRKMVSKTIGKPKATMWIVRITLST